MWFGRRERLKQVHGQAKKIVMRVIVVVVSGIYLCMLIIMNVHTTSLPAVDKREQKAE
jgi:hypothetical protein